MKTLEQGWEAFEQQFVCEDAEEWQRNDMHVAYFSGALGLLRITRAIRESAITDQQKIDAMDHLLTEVGAFQAALVVTTIIDHLIDGQEDKPH